MRITTVERDIDFVERRCIEELKSVTRAVALDCVIDETFDRVIYVIQKGDMGLAIGRKGENIRKMKKTLGRHIEMVEYDEDPSVFLANIFRPAKIAGTEEHTERGSRTVIASGPGDLRIAIGKGGSTIEKARKLCTRYFGFTIEDVRMAGDAN